MKHRVIAKLRRESGMMMGSAIVIWMTLRLATVNDDRSISGLSIAALLAPMVIAALYYGAESRRLARGDRRLRAAKPLLRAGQGACVVLLIAATADLVWRWDRIGTTTGVATAVVVTVAALTYFGYFHRRVAANADRGYRFARTPIHRMLTTKGNST
ncbi:hypothetical protein [Glycomyces tarimensis]